MTNADPWYRRFVKGQMAVARVEHSLENPCEKTFHECDCHCWYCIGLPRPKEFDLREARRKSELSRLETTNRREV